MNIPLFTIPAGTMIETDQDGRWIFFEPDKPPYSVAIEWGHGWPPTIIKTCIASDCKTTLSIGTTPR